MSYFKSNIEQSSIPSYAGIYLMKNKQGKIIYIGKAKNLKKRIKSYFNINQRDNTYKDDKNFWKSKTLIDQVNDIEFVLTDNEVEAFLLESNLIKRYRPLFNIELKDQQRYTYLKITNEKFPRLLVARRNRKGEFAGPKGDIFGPFVYGSSRFLSLGIMRKIFKIRICDRLPKKPCLEYFIHNCDAPCIGKIKEKEYYENIASLRNILGEKYGLENFILQLKMKMEAESRKQNYEEAKEIRDTIKIVQNLLIDQKIESKYETNEEYIGIKRDNFSGTDHILIFKRSNGVISDQRKYDYDLIGDNNFSNFLLQYYNSTPQIPDKIFVNEIPFSKSIIEHTLSKVSHHKVKITKVTKSSNDERRDLMNLILRNVSNFIEKKYYPPILDLKNILNLKQLPLVIDSFDVSNFGTTYGVGACVRFVNGYPFKDGYRRFKIRTLNSKQDDYAMIKEIVQRRYIRNKILKEKVKNNLTYSNKIMHDDLPNLIVIDGGRGQLTSATSVLKKSDLDIPVISLAKGNEEVYTLDSDKPLRISKKNSSLQLLQYLRDEAHRFALMYNKKLREI